jgi:uncharacterized sulfatase
MDTAMGPRSRIAHRTEFETIPLRSESTSAALLGFYDSLIGFKARGGSLFRTILVFLLLFAATGLACPLFGQGSHEHSRPNIVFVLTDDQAPWAMGGAVNDGRFTNVPAAHTPNMDRLSRDGALFTNFFCTTPVCSPARASIATGRYASELGIEDFIPSPQHRLFNPQDQIALDPQSTTTFAEVLQTAGYRTGLVGKWHLGDWTLPGHARFHPTNHGFDYFMGLTSGGTSPDNPILEKDGIVRQFRGLTTDILTDHAIEFVENANIDSKPFLLCLHTRAPHSAWLPVAPEDWSPYADLDPLIPDYPDLDAAKIKKDMREYLASTSGVDRNLGRLLDTLDRLNLSEQTIVIFTSDHGYNLGHNGIRHKGNGIWATRRKPPGREHHGTRVISDKYRPNMYDLSLKAPTLVRWPGVVRHGTVIRDTATSLDIFPTLLAMAKIAPPKDPCLRGRDLTPLLRGELPSDWNQDVYAEYSMVNYVVARMRCYRTPHYKLIRDFDNSGRDEFYDLKADTDETRNLINESSQEVVLAIADLHVNMIAMMKSINDPLLSPVEAGEQ